ncbi:MAG: hypothetical protein IJV98_02105 [Clostridia bacterium]|nr:hypothetical protein [Clostridia bacterium]
MVGLIDRLCDKLGEAIDAVDICDVKSLKELTATVHELHKIREDRTSERDTPETSRCGVLVMPPQTEGR